MFIIINIYYYYFYRKFNSETLYNPENACFYRITEGLLVRLQK